MNKVMVLGAGRGQIPLMNLFHMYGYQVITVSPKGDYPGFDVADKAVYLDVRDKEGILEYARREQICGITTDQLDAGVLTAAYIAEKLGIPGITYDVALKFTNKYIMRKAAEKAGIHTPYSVCVQAMEEAEEILTDNELLQFPVMIKPVDSSASKGVYKINQISDLRTHFNDAKQYSKCGSVIIEQYIHGKEYVVEAFTRNYVVTNLVVGHRDYFDVPDTFIPCATVFRDAVSATTELENRLKETNEVLVRAFGLPFGITHAEYMYDEDADKIYLVEIAARGGGVFISSDLIPAACGVNANELLIREVVNISEKMAIKIRPGASAYFCYLTPEGIVKKISGVDMVEQVPGVRHAYFDNIHFSMRTNSIRDKSSRKGPILVQGKTKEECYQIIEKVKKILDIEVETDHGLADVIWN